MAIITTSNGKLSVKNLTSDQLPDLPASRPGRKYWDLTVKAVILADPDLGRFLADVAWDAAAGSVTFTKCGADCGDILAASTPWTGDDNAWREELKKLMQALDKFLGRCKSSSEWSDIVPDTTGFCLPDVGERDFYRRCVLPDGSSRLVVIWGLKVGKGRKDVKFIVDSTPPPNTVTPSAPQPVKGQQATTASAPAPCPALTSVTITRPSPDTSHFEATPDVAGAVYSFVITTSTGASIPQKIVIKGCKADVQLPPGSYVLQVRAFVGAQSSNTLKQDFAVEVPKARGKYWFAPWLILLFLLIAVAAFFVLFPGIKGGNGSKKPGVKPNDVPVQSGVTSNENASVTKETTIIVIPDVPSSVTNKPLTVTPDVPPSDTNEPPFKPDGKTNGVTAQPGDKPGGKESDTNKPPVTSGVKTNGVTAQPGGKESDTNEPPFKPDGKTNVVTDQPGANPNGNASGTNEPPIKPDVKTNVGADQPDAKHNGNASGTNEPPDVIEITPKFDFCLDGEPRRIGESHEFKVSFKLQDDDKNATYTLLNGNTEVPFKKGCASVTMKDGKCEVTVQEKNGERFFVKSKILEVSDKGIETIKTDKGAEVKLK